MNKRTITIALWVVALIAIVYAIYRSTNERITVVENGREIVYGEPQHGLILGLCIFASLCVLSSVLLLLDKHEVKEHEKTTISKRTV
jgi:hypothetical protein